MPTIECRCGYTCGTAKAWFRHQEKNRDHELKDPSVQLDSDPAPPPPITTSVRATGAAGFRDALKGVGLAMASAEQNQRAMERSLSSWSKCATAATQPVLETRLAAALKHSEMPLLAAAKRGDADAMCACLESSGSEMLDRCDDVGLSPLAWAASGGHAACVEALVAAGARLGAAEHTDAVAPLFLALSKGHEACAARLLDAGAMVAEVEPIRGQTAQHAATVAAVAAAAAEKDAAVPQTALLERCLDAAPPDAPLDADRDGFTALHIASGKGCVAAVRLLLARAASPATELRRHATPGSGSGSGSGSGGEREGARGGGGGGAERGKVGGISPLAAACRRDHREVARLLRGAGAPLDAAAVHVCAARGRTEALHELLLLHEQAGEEAEAEGEGRGGPRAVDCAGADGVTALMLAAQNGEEHTVATLLEARADAAAVDADQQTALMRAAFYGHGKVAAQLCKAGAGIDGFVDAADAQGNTALHHAGRGGQEWVFDLLELKHGADGTLRNAKGEVAEVQEEPCTVQ